MSRNGSGNYSPPTNSWNPAQDGTPATTVDWQATLDDLSSAMSQSISKDGQTAYTGNQPMGGYKLTGLGAGTAAGDSVRFEQLFSQGLATSLAAGATVNIGAQNSTAITVTGTGTISSFGTAYNGPRYVKFEGACTLTHSSSLVMPYGEDIVTVAGHIYTFMPDGNPATGWRLINSADAIPANDGASGTLWTTVQGFINKIISSTGDAVVGLTPGYSGTATTLGIWVKKQVAIAENYASVQAALNSGAPIVRLTNPSYTFSSGVTIPSGVTLEGNGKAYTNIICASNITPFTMLNANDAGLEGVLITAHSTQTNQLILLDAAANTMARCRIRDVQGSGSATDFPFISIRTRNGAYGSWAHLIEDVSVSGCGTIFRAESQFAGSWINSIQMSHVYANDFIRGMHLIATDGDGASDMTFFDWATQTSARTTFGALIADVSVQGTNRKNSFTDVRFYDLPSGALSYYIGSNVLDTTINGLSVDDPTPARIKDTGINTQINGSSVFDYFARNGRTVTLLTGSGLTPSTSGTATTQAVSNYAQLRTGATSGSVARLYSTEPISGLSQSQIFNINFGLPLRITFSLTRITAGASALGRIQIKQTQADGALLAPGLGLQINNYDIFGETYGTSVNTLNVGALVDGQTFKIEIIHYPANRVEWWVNGVLRATETTAAKIPTGQAPCYLQASFNNGAAVDLQMFVNSISLQAGI